MTRQHLLVTAVVALLCGAILVLFTNIEQTLRPHTPTTPKLLPKRSPSP